jgi:hypothetical protein
MKRRRWLIVLTAVLALSVSVWLAVPALSLPRPLGSYYLGPKMIRAEIALNSNGVLHDFRIDVGRIRSASLATQTISLKERDGTMQPIQVSPTARIKVNGGSSTFAALRPGMYALTIRDGNGAADQVFATRSAAKLLLPRALQAYYLGPRMIRAEIVLKSNGVLHDFLIDAGRIQSVNAGTQTITLKEKDGTMQPIPVSPTARIKVNGTSSNFAALRRGLHATTIRDGDSPAEQVLATK